MHEHITGSEYEYMIWNWYFLIELFTIILNIFIYKITFWALSMILSNKRVLEKLQKQVDDTLGNTPGNLIKSSVWCSTWVRYSTRRKITFWICKHQKYLEIIDIIKHLFKLFFFGGGGGMINISEEQSLDVDSHFISPIRLEYLSLHCLSANTQRKKNTKRPYISC